MANNDRPTEPSEQVDPAAPTPSMGTLVIQTWREADSTSRFRARLTYSQRDDAESSTSYFADPVDVLGAVREWLIATTGTAPQI